MRTTWNKEKDDVIRHCYMCSPIPYLEEKIGTNWSAIGCRAEQLGIRRPREANCIKIDFFNKWSPEMSYILGFIAADGGISDYGERRKTLYITLSAKDYDHLAKIKNHLTYNKKIYTYNDQIRDKIYKKCSLRLGSKYMCARLMELGIYPNKSLNLKMPNVPEKYFSHFVRGYFDGDGCISKNSKTNDWFLIIVGSYDFITSLSKMLSQRIGGISEKNLVCQKNIYRLTYSTQQAIKVGKWMYRDANLFLDRKYNKFSELFRTKGNHKEQAQ